MTKTKFKDELSQKDVQQSLLINRLIVIISVVGLIATAWLIYKAWNMGLFTDEEKLSTFMHASGAWAPIFFIGIQIIQTVIQIIPGALTIPAGSMIFGNWYGFFLNFVGIMVGSIFNFWIARKYGRKIVLALGGQSFYNKYMPYLNGKGFERVFAFGMIFPISPADALCMVAGVSEMSFKRFMFWLSIGKPITLFIYGYGLLSVIHWITGLLGG